MKLLKLVALDEDDLEVLSAHMQDAIMRVGDMAWHPASHRFVALFNRFDWQGALDAGQGDKKRFERRRCAFRFDNVSRVRLKNIEMQPQSGKKPAMLELLAVNFTPEEAPSGCVELIFSGDCAIRLDVECIEVELTDLGPGWKARSMPEHEGS